MRTSVLTALLLMLTITASSGEPSTNDTTESVTRPKSEIESILRLVDWKQREIEFLTAAVERRDSMIVDRDRVIARWQELSAFQSRELSKKGWEARLWAAASLMIGLAFAYVASKYE